jgi:diguanylate cyclase (GGDEF)-like protein/PAS domain S-box-containing protein
MFLFDYEFRTEFILLALVLGSSIGLLWGRLSLARRDMVQSKVLFEALVNDAPEFSYLKGVKGEYLFVSPACETMTGYTPEAFYSDPNLFDEMIHPDDQARWSQHTHGTHNSNSKFYEFRIVDKFGKTHWVQHTCSNFYDEDDRHLGVRSSNTDITQRKNNEAKLQELASYDQLTGILNKRSLYDNCATLDKLQSSIALIMVDLDNFKQINDKYGHHVGDEVLKIVASRLKSFATSVSDKLALTPYRYGGDEFVMILNDYHDKGEIEACCASFVEQFNQMISAEGIDVMVTVSVGVGMCECGDKVSMELDGLFKQADIAMYHVKKQNKNGYALFDEAYLDAHQKSIDQNN